MSAVDEHSEHSRLKDLLGDGDHGHSMKQTSRITGSILAKS